MSVTTTSSTPGTDINNISTSEILVDPNNPVVSHPQDEQTNKDIQTFFDTHTETQTTVKHLLSQTTSIPQSGGISYIGDVNVSAFMRKQPIEIVTYNLRPNRRIYPYFDDKSVSNLIEKANIIEVDNDREFLGVMPVGAQSLPIDNVDGNGNIIGQVDTAAERIYNQFGSAKVYFTERTDTGKTRLYIDCFQSSNTGNARTYTANGFSVGDTIIGTKSGSRANIVSYTHNSGKLSFNLYDDSYSNTYGIANVVVTKSAVILSQEASDVDDYYVGRSLTLVTGGLPGETTEIIAYDGTSKTAVVSPGLRGSQVNSELIYTLGDERSPYNALAANNSIYTNGQGIFAGKFHLPNPNLSSYYRFRTGEKLLKITDSPDNKSENATAIAEYIYNSFGLNISRGQLTINYFTNDATATPGAGGVLIQSSGTNPPLQPPVGGGTISDTSATGQTGKAAIKSRRYNPIAQSFYVSEIQYPQGIFVPYIDLFFAAKGTLPVDIQIRPLINGFPDSKNIVPGSVAVVQADRVKVSTNPDVNDSNTYTRFTFNSPVYLLPGADYVFTVGSNDYDYELFVSELGEKRIGTNRIVSEQPNLGSMFKSQNSSTYTPIQSEDIMFVIHKCDFIASGSVMFSEQKVPNLNELFTRTYYNANTVFNSFELQSDVIEVPGTTVSYQYKATVDSTGDLDAEYTSFRPDQQILMPDRKVVAGAMYGSNTFFVQTDLTTTSRDVSPILYAEKQNIYTAATLINNMPLLTRGVTVSNTGTGYTTSNTGVSIAAGSGSGANGKIIVQFQDYSEGRVEGIYFDNAGYGYYGNVEISLTSTTGSGAVLSYAGETDSGGGPAVARYISKTITLAPEFEAGDLRVFLTAIKPPESEIAVYYKIRNAYDEEAIDYKKWVRMERRTGTITDTVGFTPIEYEYLPNTSSNTVVYSSNNATFNTFNQYKVKIVLASSDTSFTKIPYVYDMRAIALPGDPG